MHNNIKKNLHLLYHFRSYLDELLLIKASKKDIDLANSNQVLIESLSNFLDIPYPELIKFLFGGTDNAKTDEQS